MIEGFIRLSDLGCEPPEVPKGGKIDILLSVDYDDDEDPRTRSLFGFDGAQSQYSTRND